MFQKINQDLQKSIKDRDEVRTGALRMIKSKITYVATRGNLPDAEIIKIINKYSKELIESAEIAEKVNRPEFAARVRKELAIVAEYLPKLLSDEEIKNLVSAAIQKTGATGPKDMGRVIKEVLAQNPILDGGKVKNFVLAQLGS